MTALQAPPHGGAYRLIALNPTLRKRPWKPEIKARYEQLVTSLPESGYTEAKTNSLNSNKNDGIQAHNSSMVELRRLELLTPYLQSRCSPS